MRAKMRLRRPHEKHAVWCRGYIYATGSHSPDLMIRGASTYRFVKDHLGSPRLVVRSDGVLAQRIDYDEWGNATVVFESTPSLQPFGFAGGVWDRDIALVRFGARDYDPTIGRWAAKDPTRFHGGPNFYVYARNDAVNYIDTTGRYEAPAAAAAPVAATGVLSKAVFVAFGPAGVLVFGPTLLAGYGAYRLHEYLKSPECKTKDGPYRKPAPNPADCARHALRLYDICKDGGNETDDCIEYMQQSYDDCMSQ